MSSSSERIRNDLAALDRDRIRNDLDALDKSPWAAITQLAAIADKGAASAAVAITADQTTNYGDIVNVKSGAKEYNLYVEKRISQAEASMTEALEATQQLVRERYPSYPLHTSARPVHKALKKAFALLDPEVANAIRRDFSNNWKQIFFSQGRRIKEGKLFYPIPLLEMAQTPSDDDNSLENKVFHYFRTHKDAYKALLMYKLHKPFLLPLDISSGFQYVTSKGFHKVMMGRVQKDRKMFKRRHMKKKQ